MRNIIYGLLNYSNNYVIPKKIIIPLAAIIWGISFPLNNNLSLRDSEPYYVL
jgi:hypothetical protein